MSEFGDRMAAQRNVLALVNRKFGGAEELYGLSSKALARWAVSNEVEENSQLMSLLLQTSEQLSFLANKSQDQVTDSYKTLVTEVARLTALIRQEMELSV